MFLSVIWSPQIDDLGVAGDGFCIGNNESNSMSALLVKNLSETLSAIILL